MEDLQIKQAEYTKRLAKAADSLLTAVEEALDDSDQFHRYLVQSGASGSRVTEEQCFKKLDTKALKEVTAVLKEVSAMVRELHGMDTNQEEKTLKVVFAAGDKEWNE